MRGLDEAQAAVLVERDVAPREFEFERHRVVLRAEQHALMLEQRALLAVLKDAVGHPVGLLGLVSAGDELGTPAALSCGPEFLVAALGRFGDDRVGRGQDRRTRAVVARERDHAGVGEPRLEVEDVAHGGRPEAVDRLRVVADTRHAAAVGAQERDDLGLQSVGVLELVDEHMVEALAHAGTGLRVCEHAVPEQEQVVVVQYLLRILLVGVEREEGLEVALGVLTPREGDAEHLSERELRVDAARVDVEARRLLREARAAAPQAELGAAKLHQVLGVAAVHDREVGLEADVARVHAEQPRRHRMEGAAPNARAGRECGRMRCRSRGGGCRRGGASRRRRDA